MLVSCNECGNQVAGYHHPTKPPCNNPRQECLHCEALTKLEHSIVQARKHLEDLLEEREQRIRHFNTHNDPLNSLPTEIASEIFVLLMPTITTLDTSPDRECCYGRKSSPQMILGSVCKTWRQIIWGNPTFWTTLALCVGQRKTASEAVFIQGWLERSGSLPISLCLVESRCNTSDLPKSTFQALANVLKPHLHRCKTLHCVVGCLFGSLLRMEKEPNMEALVLEPYAMPSGSWAIFSKYVYLPLKSLQVEHYDFLRLGVQWGELTCISIHVGRVEEWNILGLCRCLQKLTVEFDTAIIPIDQKFPHLTHLRLIGAPRNTLDHLNLPALNKLELEWPFDEFEDLPDVGALVRRSGCNLQRLEMEYFDDDVSDMSIISLLQQTPSVTTLVWAGPLSYLFLGYFRETTFWDAESSGPFLPNLISFTYRSDILFLPWSSISTMVPFPPPSATMSQRPLSMVSFILDLDPSGEFNTKDAIANAKITQDELSTLMQMTTSAGIREFRMVEAGRNVDLIGFWARHYASIGSHVTED